MRICFIDYDREIVLVAERTPEGGSREIVAVGRLSRDRIAGQEAEFSLLVADPWQGRGVGRELLGRLIDVGRREKLALLHSDVLGANLRMQRLCSNLGFVLGDESSGVVRAERKL